eukprot:CAMPEP_0119379344 /NCGR_PEP_ID=MMETSP1334-20130426/52274_1 /TAXON_ID=127549 /ORGANISM="Calcidiscus leptoporus, Strain RCC1130" /LENGTH=183 /DNA_ID=CAMNT_0007398825 /DNA_START=1 /DNA_END=552 /DNA_ORIENTATION=-
MYHVLCSDISFDAIYYTENNTAVGTRQHTQTGTDYSRINRRMLEGMRDRQQSRVKGLDRGEAFRRRRRQQQQQARTAVRALPIKLETWLRQDSRPLRSALACDMEVLLAVAVPVAHAAKHNAGAALRFDGCFHHARKASYSSYQAPRGCSVWPAPVDSPPASPEPSGRLPPAAPPGFAASEMK